MSVDAARTLCRTLIERWNVQDADQVTLLRAVVGMVPPGADDLNPESNAIQSLVARLGDHGWRIVLFQNTPAAFHGRAEEVAALTDELRTVRRRTVTG